MAKRLGEQSDKTMNREVRPQWNPNDSRQFACNDAAYGEDYYTVQYDKNNNELVPGDYSPDVPNSYQSGGSAAVGSQGQFRGEFAATDAGSAGPLAKQIANMEIRPHQDDFADRRSTVGVDVMNANRGSENGYPDNQPSPDRTSDTQMDFRRGVKR